MRTNYCTREKLSGAVCSAATRLRASPTRAARPLQQAQDDFGSRSIFGGLERSDRNKEKYRAPRCTRTSPLPLLPSGPGGVGGIASRGTRHSHSSIFGGRARESTNRGKWRSFGKTYHGGTEAGR